MNTSVRCMCSDRTSLNDPAASPSAAMIRCCSSAIAARARSTRSMAVKRRIARSCPPLHGEPQHVERGLRGLILHLLAVADELKRADPGLLAGDDRDGHRADGLFRRTPVRPCDPRYADAHDGAGASTHALGHRSRDLLADGAELLDQLLRHPEELRLRPAAVAANPAVNVAERAGNVGEA